MYSSVADGGGRGAVRVRVRVRVRCFVVTRRQNVLRGAVCTAVLRNEEVEELHLGSGWKGGCTAC